MNIVQHSVPRHCYQWIFLFIVLCLVIFSATTYKNLRANLDHDISLTPENLTGYSNVSLTAPTVASASLPLIEFPQHSGAARLKISFPVVVKTGVLELEVDPSAELFKNTIAVRVVSSERTSPITGQPESLGVSSNRWLPLRPDNLTYRIPLLRSHIKTGVILEFKYLGPIPGIPITTMRLRPATFLDFPVGAMLVSISVMLLMFLPGLLVILSFQSCWVLPLPLTTFLTSSLATLVMFAFYKLLKVPPLPFSILTFTLSGLIFLLRLKSRSFRKKLSCFGEEMTPDLNVLAIILGTVILMLSFGDPSPVHNIDQGHITGEHTFMAFTAHDSVFQFVNSKALIEGDFEKYYGTNGYKKLLFMPQDREILPGLSYAPIMLTLQSIWGQETGAEYFSYSVFFLVCHGLLLSMVFCWLKSHNLQLAYIATFFICTTPVFWTLAAVGWFKLTGAALVLAGVFLVRKDSQKLSYWVWAGLLFGLAKNYHGANALALPVLTLWMLFLAYQADPEHSIQRSCIRFILLTVSALLVMLPWNYYVGITWNTGTHLLFSIHFLEGNFIESSLLQSIVQFFQQHTWTEQLKVRSIRTISLFNLPWLIDTYSQYGLGKLGALGGWLTFSSSYLCAALLPYLGLAVILRFVARVRGDDNPGGIKAYDPWSRQFGGICLINILFLIFLSYGPPECGADITWHLPPLLIIGLIIHFISSTTLHSKHSIFVWGGLGFFQLGLLAVYG